MSGTEHYGHDIVAILGQLWGEGYLSSGGPEELARIVSANPAEIFLPSRADIPTG